jgi:hypothetical protein
MAFGVGTIILNFFHRMANGRKRKFTIFSLKNGDTTIMGDAELLAHATDYYKDLFGPAPGNLFNLDPDYGSHMKT